jgi:uncharacterized protein
MRSFPDVCMLLKAPVPGRVKTRLGRDVGAEKAAEIYRSLVERQMAGIPGNWNVMIAYDPPDAESAMRAWLGNRPHYFQQSDGDLGERLINATTRLFAADSAGVLFIGGDCPALDVARLTEAADALKEADLALIPAVDGGYCLIGLAAKSEGVFEGIAWSTPDVFVQTVARCSALGLTLRVLEPALEDVDDLNSWQRALASGTLRNPPGAEST